jgi:hypothetical protein
MLLYFVLKVSLGETRKCYSDDDDDDYYYYYYYYDDDEDDEKISLGSSPTILVLLGV